MDVVQRDVLAAGKVLQAQLKSAISKTKTAIANKVEPVEFYRARLATLQSWSDALSQMYSSNAAGGGCRLQSLDEWSSK